MSATFLPVSAVDPILPNTHKNTSRQKSPSSTTLPKISLPPSPDLVQFRIFQRLQRIRVLVLRYLSSRSGIPAAPRPVVARLLSIATGGWVGG